ncbi:protein kinase [Sphaerospermopsis aphanizomenoides BCCUSP55]|uniref:protein kinase domain-containing protein n=1 Tax=Sphaerospermopsis aphanizomenoides TaxID=459663 RepID=UPI0019078821|nr:serine/threonine-protein kinase [Sphaerospermopsis aphanizomenoides]MBK1990496.1 protein kinase [Sphaerospermopsis aphanizomenoides BCCUSP55]
MVLSQINQSAVHCINPKCQRPYPQPWGNKFCNSCGTPLQLLDRYYPMQPLGSGGFAQIYTVWDEKTQTEKVLKVLVEDSPKALELFIQEAEVLSSFHHPGVPKVESDGYFQINLTSPKPHQLACLVMEKIDGHNLEKIRKNYPQGCPEDLVLNWFAQAVKILQELHKRQIIHRDIKPSNLMLRTPSPTAPLQAEQLVLIDFGGAKQFSGAILRSHSPSTRLFSSGYSPPEQMVGGNVGPAADFYALGRTMIELLTGKYPQELEDPITGELRWRKWCNVNPQLADLLDEMIQTDVRSRPAHAAIIQKRLLKIVPAGSKPSFFTQTKTTVIQSVTQFTQAVGNTTLLTVQAIFRFLLACLATIWAIILSGIGASLGTVAGFWLAYHTKLGAVVQEFLSLQLPELLPNFKTSHPKEIIVYGVAGLATAWGITLSKSFGQKRRFLVSALMGLIGYSFGWIIWQFIKPQDSAEGLIAWMLVSISLLTLGLGLRSHYLAYAFITAFGSANILAGLIHLGLKIQFIHFSNQPNGWELLQHIAFFGFIGILISFCLGLSYYLIVPCLRWLGWR